MAASLNKCAFIGNLGHDPEVRTTRGGTSVCNIRIACNERVKRDGEWVDHVEWVTIICWGKTAENVGKYLKKGSQIYAEGRMQTRKWQDRDGVDRWSTEINAYDVKFLGGNNSGDGNRRDDRRDDRGRGRDDRHSDYDDGGAAYDGPDDDIPF